MYEDEFPISRDMLMWRNLNVVLANLPSKCHMLVRLTGRWPHYHSDHIIGSGYMYIHSLIERILLTHCTGWTVTILSAWFALRYVTLAHSDLFFGGWGVLVVCRSQCPVSTRESTKQ